MGGSLAGTDSWFANPLSQVSAHYGVGLNGEIHQYVALSDGAWANGILEFGNTWPGPAGVNPNYLTVSIETEDKGSAGTSVSDDEYNSVLQVCRTTMREFPMFKYLMGHNVISPRSRANSPGGRWTASGRFDDLASELGLESIP